MDLVGKHGRVRTVPMPTWVKLAVDAWTAAAGVASGHVFRAVNRAFRIVARTILRIDHPADDDLATRLSDTLRRLARRRLEIGLLDAREVEHLLMPESDGRDDWLAFLILTAWSEIDHLLENRGPGSD